MDRRIAVDNQNEHEITTKISHLASERKLHKKSGFVIGETDNNVLPGSYDGDWPYFKIETLLQQYPKTPLEILDRTLLNLGQLNDFPGSEFEVRALKENRQKPETIIAFTNDWDKQLSLFSLLEDEKFIKINLDPVDAYKELTGTKRISSIQRRDAVPLIILPKGYQRIRELQSTASGNERQAFVAMWFEPTREKYYESMDKAARDAGFEKCLRIDNKEHNNKICDEIIAEIRRSQCVIADFTGHRGGVYFEAGFAMGLGIPVIWLVEEKEIGNIHFDTRQYSHIAYKDENDLYARLKARILATIDMSKR